MGDGVGFNALLNWREFVRKVEKRFHHGEYTKLVEGFEIGVQMI